MLNITIEFGERYIYSPSLRRDLHQRFSIVSVTTYQEKKTESCTKKILDPINDEKFNDINFEKTETET